jgi:hypothetical protein
MDPNSNRPPHQPETEFAGEVQEFSGPALSPMDPTLEPRVRKGRPANRKPIVDAENPNSSETK